MAEHYSIVCVDHLLFICSPADEQARGLCPHRGSFGTVLLCTLVGRHMFEPDGGSLGCVPGGELLAHVIAVSLAF